ncbi:Ribonuclease 3 [Mycolicibacterium aubagnense]
MTVDRAPLLAALGVRLPDDLLTVALTHRSYAYENGGLPTNERLEFLGDAVLGLVITAEIFRRYPDRSEGELAKLKSAVVNTQALAEIARSLPPTGWAATCCWAGARWPAAVRRKPICWLTDSNRCSAQRMSNMVMRWPRPW